MCIRDRYAPWPHSFQAKFSATPALLSVETAVTKIGNSVASVRANVSNYSDPTADVDYNIRLDAKDFASIVPAYKPTGLSLIHI